MGSDIPLSSSQVSKQHAEFTLEGDELWIRDLCSSNGTYVNRTRVDEPVRLRNGDLIHFADVELLVCRDTSAQDELNETGIMLESPAAVATGVHSQARALRALINTGAVAAEFQPIVSLHGPAQPAFEVLGRGTSNELPESPSELFEIAEHAGLAAHLSSSLRRAALLACEDIPDQPRIYTNVHPAELAEGDILHNLGWFRQRYPDLPLTVEVHESTVTDPREMRELHAQLKDIQIELAYDDFGAGQARLLELTDCPPDCLKFDISLIRDLDEAPDSRQRMVEALVRVAKDTGALCLAEGVERAAELDVCRALGFDLAQGHFIARPAPASAWQEPWVWDRWCGEASPADDDRGLTYLPSSTST